MVVGCGRNVCPSKGIEETMMTKTLAFLAAIGLAVLLTGCGETYESETTTTTTTNTTETVNP
jgi:hypothetical protein